jgi:poly-gamma-glutamate synthesis protein (capsule biosynthesis protein)
VHLRHPSPLVLKFTDIAREHGADLVINHMPHVVGGFDWDGSSFVAWTLGNFIFDQTVWPTFQSYVLAVHMRGDEVVRAYAEPIMLEGYISKGLTGGLAEYVVREGAGREVGPFIMEAGAVEVDIGGRATFTER